MAPEITPVPEGQHAGEFVLKEPYDELLRKKITVVSGQNLQAGTVVGQITVGGKYQILDPAESNGAEDAAGILYDNVDASSGDKDGVIIDEHAAVQDEKLVWPAGILDAAKATAEAQLKARFVHVIDRLPGA